jgi:hypothetical protein
MVRKSVGFTTPVALPASRALPTPPTPTPVANPPESAAAPVRPCPSPPPPREACPRPCTGHPPPSPHSAAATTHRRSGVLNPVRRRHPVRGRPVRPPPVRRNCTGDPSPSPQSAAATSHRGSGALNPVRRRRPVRPPPIRHRSRGHRRPPSAPLWLTPEPPSLSTVHRCPDSRGYQLLRSCNDGGKIYLLCSLCHRLLLS